MSKPVANVPLKLSDFLPYRLSVLANTVSRAIAAKYSSRFDLTVPEWRVLAVLGESPGLSAGEVAERTAMDKVAVSRAVATLVKTNRVDRQVATEDRRRSELRLSEEGLRVYKRIVPMAQALERELISALSKEQRGQLNDLLDQLQREAEKLQR